MHLLVREGTSLDEIGEPQDLGLDPADFILLSFSDSDLATFRKGLSVRDNSVARQTTARFVNLAALRHPISADLFTEKTLPGTKAVLLRLLGGLDYWRYGAEELAHACRKHGVTLAVLSGDGRPDPRLPALSTLAPDELEALDSLIAAGGPENAALAISALLGRAEGRTISLASLKVNELPAYGVYRQTPGGDGSVAIIFYRSFLHANDTGPVDALLDAVAANGDGPGVTAYYVPSLKDADAATWLKQKFGQNPPDVIINTTAFAARGESGQSVLDSANCPVLQTAMAGNTEAAWQASARGLSATDLAMHVVLPEIDGRLFTGVISFKERSETGESSHRPYPPGVAHVAALSNAWLHLRKKPRQDRKLALVLSTYPGRPDQIAHAVGLDGPESALKFAHYLGGSDYQISGLPGDTQSLLKALISDGLGSAPDYIVWPLSEYEQAFTRLPAAFRETIMAAWGEPQDDPAVHDGSMALSIILYGNLIIGLQPERGFLADRKSGYHDPKLPPRHSYIAFYLWLRGEANIDALIHLGAHGTLEWLPGKAVALSPDCAPQAVLGALPVIYPFIVNDPGEAAQAKRRIAAVTIGHNTPPIVETAPSSALLETERLLDEYSAAEGLDKKRRERLARDILNFIAANGLGETCGVKPEMTPAEALMRVDAFLCDVKALAIRDGLHILEDGELEAIGRALDGRFIEPGPSGAPSRGRADVLPTGRNLYSIDPRTIPTPLACENGARMAEAIISRYVEDHGDWPKSMVLDLWGSQTMRTGGEELGTALALLGVKPTWDYQSFRVSGFEIIPLAKLGRPRVDVTLRISGLLRDMFPAQLTLFHAAVQKVASLNEDAAMNPLARAGASPPSLYRIFGAPSGSYGAGVTQRVDAGDWQSQGELGQAYLEASGTAYAGDSEGVSAEHVFRDRVQAADFFLHIQDHCEVDVLGSPDYAAHEGGFGAAAALLGDEKADLYHADSLDPAAPKVRTLQEECARVLHGRALSPRWLEGQMRHGFRGAGEIATTADTAFAFAATAGAISSESLEHLYNAYLGDPAVASFLARENGAALAAIQSRFKEAIARSLWRPRRNDLSALETRTKVGAAP